VIVSVSMIF